MELIYANHDMRELGMLKNPEFDLAFGEDENNFECTVNIKDHVCKEGYYIYAEGTEYGGIVDAIEIDSEDDIVTYSGRSWHGILASKFIPSGFTVSGDGNTVVSKILDNVSLSPLFAVTEDTAGINVESYTYPRYVDAYTGLKRALKNAGLRLKIVCDEKVVTLSAVPVFDFSDGKELESDLIEYQMTKTYRNVNHLIMLGGGFISTRQAVHLYLDENGKVSETQTFTGVEEYISVQGERDEDEEDPEEDMTAEQRAEERENLIESGREQLLDMQKPDEIEVDFDSDDDIYYIGDIVGAYDSRTEISVAASVSKKIVTIKRGLTNISYEVKGDKNNE